MTDITDNVSHNYLHNKEVLLYNLYLTTHFIRHNITKANLIYRTVH